MTGGSELQLRRWGKDERGFQHYIAVMVATCDLCGHVFFPPYDIVYERDFTLFSEKTNRLPTTPGGTAGERDDILL